MSLKTIALGLTLKIPNRGHNPWTSDFEAEFAEKVSAHDHTGTGKGTQIPTGGIANNAVTQAKLAATIPGLGLLHKCDTLDLVSPTETELSRSVMPCAGAVTHLSVSRLASGASTLKATLIKNGSTTGKYVEITGTTYSGFAAIVAETFAAGDVLSFYLENTAGAQPALACASAFGYMRL